MKEIRENIKKVSGTAKKKRLYLKKYGEAT
jgi:hypothetical protein